MKKKMFLIILIGAALTAGACSGKKPTSAYANVEDELQQKEQEIVKLQSSMQNLEVDLQKQKAEAEANAAAAAEAERVAREAEARARSAEASAEGSAVTPTVAKTGGMELLPPNAKPGECYARVFVAPTYGTETERVLKREASDRVEIVPARYEWAEEKVLVRDASERLEVIPAKYETRKERVLVKEATSTMEEVPAKYDWVEEKVLVEPAHTVWKKGRGPIEKLDEGTGEIMCLVDVPAQYKTVKKRVLKTPATTRKIDIPAEYKTVEKTVLVQSPTTRKIDIPAEYANVKVQKMVSPPQERRVAIPEEWETVTKTAQRTDGRMEWREVLCETNMTRTTLMDIQRALQRAGHSPGPIDGIYGPLTGAAVRSYQQAKGLSTGGLTLATIKKLGVSL